MNTRRTSAGRAARIVAGRLHQRMGWPGIAGAMLILLALQVGFQAWWSQRRMPSDIASAHAAMARRDQAPAKPTNAMAAPARVLPSREDVPSVLDQTARGAALMGLGWPSASYQLVPASDIAPARLEVRCNFKGSYPKLKAFLDDYLSAVPGATVRELTMSRPHSDVAEVDAKFVLAVLLNDEARPPAFSKPEAVR